MKFVLCLVFILAVAPSSRPGDFKWKWSRDLPKQVATGVPPKNRSTAKVEALFARKHPPTITQILATLGQPDGYSTQLYNPPAGSLLWRLADGELHVDTGDYNDIYQAVRFDKKRRMKLLYK